MRRPQRISINVEELISKVHGHRVLWDPTAAGYSDQLCKDAAWDAIVRSMYPESEEYEEVERKVVKKKLKIKWRSVRNQFSQEITHQDAPRDSASPSKRPHLYLEQLMFLRPYLELHNCESEDRPPVAEEPDQGQEPNQGLSISTTQEEASSVSQEGKNSLVSPQMATSPTVPNAATSRPKKERTARHKIRRLTSGTDTGDELDFQVASFITRSTREDHADVFCRTLSTFIRKVNDNLKARLECAILALAEACTSPCNPIELLDYVIRWQLEHPPVHRTSATSSSQTEQDLGYGPSAGPSLDTSTGIGPSPSDVARADAGQSQNWPSGQACSSEVHNYSAPIMQYSGYINPSQTSGQHVEGTSWPPENAKSLQNTNQNFSEYSVSQPPLHPYPTYPTSTLGTQQFMAHYSAHHTDPYPEHLTTSATHSPPSYTQTQQSYDSSTSYSSSQPNTTLSYLSSLLDLSSDGHRTPPPLNFQSSTPAPTHRAVAQLTQPSSCIAALLQNTSRMGGDTSNHR